MSSKYELGDYVVMEIVRKLVDIWTDKQEVDKVKTLSRNRNQRMIIILMIYGNAV